MPIQPKSGVDGMADDVAVEGQPALDDDADHVEEARHTIDRRRRRVRGAAALAVEKFEDQLACTCGGPFRPTVTPKLVDASTIKGRSAAAMATNVHHAAAEGASPSPGRDAGDSRIVMLACWRRFILYDGSSNDLLTW